MKTFVRNLLLLLTLFVVSAAYGASPAVNITVRNKASGKAVKQIKTDSNGNFAIGSLPGGSYTLEFRGDKSAGVSKQEFSIAVDGTKQDGKQAGISGKSLASGVALNVEVKSGSNVRGQVSVGANAAHRPKMVWIPPMLGSHMPGHWAEEGSAEATMSKNRGSVSKEGIQKMQEKAVGMGPG